MPFPHPHVFSLRPSYFLHMPWHHIFNLRHTCVYYVCTMRNPCPLMLSSNPISNSRLFLILLDPKSFQTTLDSITWLPGHVLSIHCRLIIILSYLCLANPNPSQSLSTLSSYNTEENWSLKKVSSDKKVCYWKTLELKLSDVYIYQLSD